jgi:hypothetical protein
MNDIEKKFTKSGEITYLSIVDSLQAHGGNGRLKLSWINFSDPRITSYKILWNSGKDSVVLDINNESRPDTIHLMLTDMAEGTYYFEVYALDTLHHSSLSSTIIGMVYGANYAASLLPIAYETLSRIGDSLQIIWQKSAGNIYTGGSLRYSDNQGKFEEVALSSSKDTTILAAFPIGGSFEYTSGFLPESGAIDTFYTNQTTVNIPMDTVNWNDYVSIFGHLGSLLAEDATGKIFWYGANNENGFELKMPSLLDYPWYIFDTVLSYQDNLIGRETATGFLYRYNVDENGVLGPAHWRIGPAGWGAFNLLFTNDEYLYAREPDGSLWQYPLLPGGAMGSGIQVIGLYSQYDKMVAIGTSFLFCRDHSGNLWRITVGSGGQSSDPIQVAQQWDIYNMISTLGTDILARKKDGTLWRIPVDTNGNIGQPSAITIAYEVFK